MKPRTDSLQEDLDRREIGPSFCGTPKRLQREQRMLRQEGAEGLESVILITGGSKPNNGVMMAICESMCADGANACREERGPHRFVQNEELPSDAASPEDMAVLREMVLNGRVDLLGLIDEGNL